MPIFRIEKVFSYPLKWGRWTFSVISTHMNQFTTETRFSVQTAHSQSLTGKLDVLSRKFKKEKKKHAWLEHFTHTSKRPPYTYNFRFVHLGWGHRRHHPCQVSSQSVLQFRLTGWSKFTISNRLGEWLLKQCYAQTCYTVIGI